MWENSKFINKFINKLKIQKCHLERIKVAQFVFSQATLSMQKVVFLVSRHDITKFWAADWVGQFLCACFFLDRRSIHLMLYDIVIRFVICYVVWSASRCDLSIVCHHQSRRLLPSQELPLTKQWDWSHPARCRCHLTQNMISMKPRTGTSTRTFRSISTSTSARTNTARCRCNTPQYMIQELVQVEVHLELVQVK